MKRSLRPLCLLLALVLCLTVFTACSEGEDFLEPDDEGYEDTLPEEEQPLDGQNENPGASIGTWSVFVYLCGTDLESGQGSATQNLEEMFDVSTNGNVNLVVQTGGTAEWWTEGISADTLGRYIIEDGFMTLVDEQPSASMGDANTLGSFLTWGVENYPAEKYMVVFWNHGGGAASGVAFDELYNSDSLTLPEIGAGLAAANAHFEVIGFDTCLMATLENAAMVAPYGSYMVASEETEPGGGWAYDQWLQPLADDPAMDGEQLGRIICDSYMDKCESTGDRDMATLSVTDLTAIPQLVASFDAMADEMTGVTEELSTLQTFAQGAIRAESYGGNNEEEGYTNMVDLGDLTINTQDVVSATAETVLDDLFSAVKYNVCGASRSQANGLSVFFPLGTNLEELDLYAPGAVSGSYLRFIEAFIPDWTVPEDLELQTPAVENAVNTSDYAFAAETSLNQDGYYQLNITGDIELVQSVQFALYYMDHEYNEYMCLGMDNDIEADWESGVFLDNFRSVWMTLDGNLCAPTLVAEEDGYNIYTIPVMLNGERTNLRAAYIWDSEEVGHYEIYGAWKGIDTDSGMSDRNIVKLKGGDEVTLLFDAVNWDTGEEITYEMGSFTVSGTVVMDETSLPDGDYLYQYVVTDIHGEKTYTKEAIMEIRDGETTIYETEEA